MDDPVISLRDLVENIVVAVPLLAIGIFTLVRWEEADLIFWVGCVVFVVGSTSFWLWKRPRSRFS